MQMAWVWRDDSHGLVSKANKAGMLLLPPPPCLCQTMLSAVNQPAILLLAVPLFSLSGLGLGVGTDCVDVSGWTVWACRDGLSGCGGTEGTDC